MLRQWPSLTQLDLRGDTIEYSDWVLRWILQNRPSLVRLRLSDVDIHRVRHNSNSNLVLVGNRLVFIE